MYELPEIDIGDIDSFADWLELCALASPERCVSTTWASEVVRTSGLLGNIEEGGFSGDDLYSGPEDFSAQDAAASFAEVIWQVLQYRSRILGEGYPYRVDGKTLERKVSDWGEALNYLLLLLCDIGRRYQLDTDETVGLLFEKVVAASAKKIFRGTAVRFGWPKEPGWPSPIEDRVIRLGEELNLPVEDLEGKLTPYDKDIGLDVVARHSFGDDGPAAVTYLIQCGTGENWRNKTGEPAIEAWRPLLQWNSVLVRAIAVPWRLEKPYDYRRIFRSFGGAIALDRPRLMSVSTDELVDSGVRSKIRDWCESRLESLPTLK